MQLSIAATNKQSDEIAQSAPTQITRVDRGQTSEVLDHVALEEPLEIRLDWLDGVERQRKSVSITMRTPGNDNELAAGFLFTEGVVRSPTDIEGIVGCGPDHGAHGGQNIVKVRLADHAKVEWPKLQRHFYATSSCGVCGKASLDALEVPGLSAITDSGFRIEPNLICALQDTVRARQSVFDQTGGLHAAALFNAAGELLAVREDVGRHNAVDKLLGAQFLAGRAPLSNQLLFLSGRASFELVQKALVAGVPMIVAVGAPSSLAVELAKRFNISLVGFARGERFNIYNGAFRVSATCSVVNKVGACDQPAAHESTSARQ
ncbi:MAG: formate dehydrogenase accessory sulfurtransferase FdhD [Phycisphaerales bacterium]|nr:formate dehydrogenase accessory sulfurtransferase FdhD [Phycisphaerales bacterium]